MEELFKAVIFVGLGCIAVTIMLLGFRILFSNGDDWKDIR